MLRDSSLVNLSLFPSENLSGKETRSASSSRTVIVQLKGVVSGVPLCTDNTERRHTVFADHTDHFWPRGKVDCIIHSSSANADCLISVCFQLWFAGLHAASLVYGPLMSSTDLSVVDRIGQMQESRFVGTVIACQIAKHRLQGIQLEIPFFAPSTLVHQGGKPAWGKPDYDPCVISSVCVSDIMHRVSLSEDQWTRRNPSTL